MPKTNLHWPPDRYPLAFAEMINLGGIWSYEAFRWTPKSLKLRFYGYIAALRAAPSHRFHDLAMMHNFSWQELDSETFKVVALPIGVKRTYTKKVDMPSGAV